MLVALVIWVGGIIFFSFVAAPAIFQVLAKEDAGRLVRAIFPRYYKLGIGCGVLTTLSLAGLGIVSGRLTGPLAADIVIVTLMMCLTIYSLVLVPRINAARDAGQEQEERFKKLHRRSVVVNAVVLFLGLAALAVIAHFLMNPI